MKGYLAIYSLRAVHAFLYLIRRKFGADLIWCRGKKIKFGADLI